MKHLILLISLFLSLFGKIVLAQSFVNGDLEGVATFPNMLPSSWSNVPYTDPICNATMAASATTDLVDINGPDITHGLIGNPYSGNTFVSGLIGTALGTNWQEGIQQHVTGFAPGSNYTITFYQTIVKQINSDALDTSGGWAVYIDGTLVATTNVSHSQQPAICTTLDWDYRIVTFEATSTEHTIKFLPIDDDTTLVFSGLDGALRMGIDNIELHGANFGIESYTNESLKASPNPTLGKVRLLDFEGYSGTVSIEIFNVLGQNVANYTYHSATDIIEFEIKGEAGLYFIHVKKQDGKPSLLKITKY